MSACNDTGSINLYAPSEVSDVPYCNWVGEENDMDVDDKHVDESYGMSSLGTQVNVEYATPKSQVGQTSQAASVNPSLSQQRVSNKDTPSNQNTGSNMFNVHLNYDPNIALDPDSWDGNFHVVSLHGSMEHLALDALNIKESLSRIHKYILGKSIKNSGANDIEDFKGMGKAMWEFISAIYNSHWNSFFVDDNNMTFRNKVKSQFSPQVIKPKDSSKGKEMVKPAFVSSLSPPIPAKSQKEVNKISKYFKKNNNANPTKLYAQASSSSKKTNTSSSAPVSDITRNTLKIKESFPNLPNAKINLIQKVINDSNSKPKPRINMTMKGLSRKQVIIPMSNNLSKKFTKDSSMHVININRALKDINSKTIVDFIHVEDKGIVITTNNISLNSDLQEIEKYVKNSLSTDAEQISPPRLPQSKSYLKIVGIPYNSGRLQILVFLPMMSNTSSRAITYSTTLSLPPNPVSSRSPLNLTCPLSGSIFGTCKAVLMQKKSSTDDSMWEAL